MLQSCFIFRDKNWDRALSFKNVPVGNTINSFIDNIFDDIFIDDFENDLIILQFDFTN